MMPEILTSLIAAALAIVSLGWNIYRDVLSKSVRVRVTGMVAAMVIPGKEFGPEGPPECIVISAANRGPSDTTLSTFVLQKASFFKKSEFATTFPDYKNLASAQLPCELKVGKHATFIFPFYSDCFLEMDLSHIGIADVFGKTHWMKTRQVKKMRSRWCEEFQDA